MPREVIGALGILIIAEEDRVNYLALGSGCEAKQLWKLPDEELFNVAVSHLWENNTAVYCRVSRDNQ